MKNLPVAFEGHTIRRVYDEKAEKWYFSVVDVVQVLTQQPDFQAARNYWKVLKNRLRKEGSQSVTNCNRLKLPAADGKAYLTDVADPETLLRLVQSVPSPKAEPIKLWLARVGYERMQEMADPARAVDRARETWQKHGRSDKWIQQRMTGQETRNKLTDYWSTHEIKAGEEFAILTNIIHQEWSGVTVKGHKEIKGLKSQNLRDHMSEAELIFTALAEFSTRQIAEKENATGMPANTAAARSGGGIARKARLELEGRTGKSVVTGENYLPPAPPSRVKRIKGAGGARVMPSETAIKCRHDERSERGRAGDDPGVAVSESWTAALLGDVCEFIDRRGVTPEKLGSQFMSAGHRVISARNIKSRGINTTVGDQRFVDGSTYRRWMPSPILADDVLLTSEAPLGEPAYVAEQLEWCIGQRLFCLRSDKSKLDGRFLFYAFQSDRLRKDLMARASGATAQGVRQAELRKVSIHLPPVVEQRRIVAILDEAFAAIATAKANTEQNLANARAVFESHRQAVLTQRGDGWQEMPFADLCDIKHGFAFKSEFFTDEGEYVLLTPGNFFEWGGYRDRGDKQKYYQGEIPKGFILNEGDLLVAMTEQAAGLLGSPILVPESNKFLHNQRLGLVQKKPGVPWVNEYFFHIFNLRRVRDAIHESGTGVKVRHTSPTKIGEVVVAFPSSVADQRTTVQRLTALTTETQRLESLAQRKLSALATLKASLLHHAFTGQLTARNVAAAV